MKLRDYQLRAVEMLREGLREGHTRQILCAPTGSGKTVIAAHLINEAIAKGSKAVFVCDLVALVAQTSQRLFSFGIPHGIAQGANTARRSLPVQVCSAQTLERRGFWPDLDLVINDEAHTQRKAMLEFIRRIGKPVVGLTATPFAKGLGETYSNVVNVTTTDQLVKEGWIVPLKAYAAREVDMSGAKVNNLGEWASGDVERRAGRIVGDIVSCWKEKTEQHFGGPVKTLVFSATVAHGEDLCREFQAAGFDFQQVSYRDGSDSERMSKIDAYRKGEITGLVSCEALAKGFDVEDVLCGISARPYRKSLASHIQQLGRVMRSSAGKDYALWLCHSGNYLGFWDEMLDFFASGVDKLDDGERASKIRKPTDIKAHLKCFGCGYIFPAGAQLSFCPSCGLEKARPRPDFEIVPGEMDVVQPESSRSWLQDQAYAWRHIQRVATMRRPGDYHLARKFALAQYRNWFGAWPRLDFKMDTEAPDARVESKVRKQLLKYWKAARNDKQHQEV